jgi:stage V sporulation protein R
MNKQELQRLAKIEERIMQIATEDLRLRTCPVEFDIVPDQKMLEILAYNIPTNISNWKYGRDYERLRTINENVNPSLPYEVVINCLKHDTKIFTKRGIINISDLCIFDEVWNGVKFNKVLHIKKNESSDNVKIRFVNNKVVECTSNHKYPVINENGLVEKFAKDINENDYFLYLINKFDNDLVFYTDDFDYIPSLNGFHMDKFAYTRYCKIPEMLDEKLSELMGIIIGDGSIGHTKTKASDIIIGHPDIENGNNYDNYIVSLIRDIFDIEPKIIEKKTKDNYVKIVQLLSSEIKEFFNFCGLKKNFTNKNKRVPHSIFLSNIKCRCAFLRGLFDTDGCFSDRGITFSCYNEDLAKDVNILLDSLGIKNYITLVNNKSNRICGIRIVSDGRFLFKKMIGSSIKRKREQLEMIVSSKYSNDNSLISIVPDYFYNKYNITNRRGLVGKSKFKEKIELDEFDIELFNNFNFLKVKSVENVKERDIYYDINIDSDDHLFNANGVLSHNSDPARAYLMKSNTFAVQVLVMAHVIGHTSFFTMNEYFKNSKKEIIDYMFDAKERFNKYEKKYGIGEVEKIVDAAHSLYLHTNPFDTETEEQRIKKIYEQERKEAHKSDTSQFGIISGGSKRKLVETDIELFNQRLWKNLNTRTPVEPTSDILQYIIDKSPILDEWSVDILKVIRTLGQYYWPIINTKFMNEGFACVTGDTLINTDHGLLSIKEIVDNKMNIKAYDGEVFRNINNWFINENKKRIKIITRDGYELKGGYDHKILVDNEWKKLSDLSIDDNIIINKHDYYNNLQNDYVKVEYNVPVRKAFIEICNENEVDYRTVKKIVNDKKVLNRNNCIEKSKKVIELYDSQKSLSHGQSKRIDINIPSIIDENMASYLGYMVGDGNIGYGVRKHYQIFTNGDKKIIDDFANKVKVLFGFDPVIRELIGKWRVISSHGNLTDFLINHIGMKYGYAAGIKEVPECILKSPKSVVCSFIRSYFDSDGCVTKSGNIVLITKSEILSKQIQNLLINLGIYSIRRLQKSDNCYRLIITGIDSKIYMEKIGFYSDKKMGRLVDCHKNKKWYISKEYKNKIVSIEIDYGETYDITVDETHKYESSGFINHNCIVHEYIMNKLFEENVLTTSEHAQFNYSNSLVKAENPFSMNPYLIGSKMWENVIERWDKGQYGKDYENETNRKKKEEWDTHEKNGWNKVLSVMEKYTDWFFMQDFLTPDLINDMKMYVYVIHDAGPHEDFILTDSDAKDIKKLIVGLFSNNGIPKINVVDGNYKDRGYLLLKHEWSNVDLNIKYAEETMKHIYNIWGKKILLKTKMNDENVSFGFSIDDKNEEGDFVSNISIIKEKK